jgi:manganese/iron transport system permease protein/iron/zinc/copper transport system permease protein
VAVVGGIALLVGLVILLFYKQLLFTTFDSEVAQVYGVRTQWVDTLFALALAAAIIASMQVLGVTLIAAALVIPAITARLLTDSFGRMMAYAVAIGVTAGALGMYLSFYVDVASGATIVLLQAAAFAVALTISGLRHQAGRRLAHVHVD